MGAMCGKSQHFEGEGHQLNTLSTPQHQSSHSQQPKPTTLPTTTPSSPNPEMRDALAKAAEARVLASKTRGGHGSLSKSLAQQKSDGGRTQEAIEIGAGGSRSGALVWD